MEHLPKAVLKFTEVCDCWIVGSAALYYKHLTELQRGNYVGASLVPPRDYDILVPFEEWQKAAILIPPDCDVNSFGGWKFEIKKDARIDERIQIDIWPGLLHQYMSRPQPRTMWHVRTNSFWYRG